MNQIDRVLLRKKLLLRPTHPPLLLPSTLPSESEPKFSRKRKRNPANWKSKIAKALRNTGKAY